MASCEILDFRCIFVNELIGSATLAIVLLVVLYFITASKLKFGFDTTLLFFVPIVLMIGLAIGSFDVLFAFLTMFGAILLAWIFDRIIGNK